MKLIVLGSSSKGNCYLLDNGEQCLIIECGIAWQHIQQALDFHVSRIVGAIISHEHQDHAKHVGRVLKANIPVYTSCGTAQALNIDNDFYCNTIEPLKWVTIGAFRVMPFDVQHDAAEPFGFLISHPETGRMLFATDTYYLKYTFANLNNILIECNYRLDILNQNVSNGVLPVALRKRTMRSHMEYFTTLETLQANDLQQVNNIVLIHLSSGNADANAFKQGVEQATGKHVSIARAGLTIDNFNVTPF